MTFGVGDVIGCAIDLRRGAVYFTRNGTPGRRITTVSGCVCVSLLMMMMIYRSCVHTVDSIRACG
jgi:hypothetical protein